MLGWLDRAPRQNPRRRRGGSNGGAADRGAVERCEWEGEAVVVAMVAAVVVVVVVV